RALSNQGKVPPGSSQRHGVTSPEVASILARLREARVADGVERIVHEELQRWYGHRRLSTIDVDRLGHTTIAICAQRELRELNPLSHQPGSRASNGRQPHPEDAGGANIKLGDVRPTYWVNP